MRDEAALIELLTDLKAQDYGFSTITPASHARVLARPAPSIITVRDIFGWNREFEEHQIEPRLLELLRRADSVEQNGSVLRSQLRVASLDGNLFIHSSFPTDAPDAVFFGPDSFRFARMVAAHIATGLKPAWVVDMGSGSGVGGIIAAKRLRPARLSLVDVNPSAALFARVNATFAGVDAEIIVGDQVPGGCDLVIANPPYLIDSAHRTYRDGGASLGAEVALQWIAQGLTALAPGGTFLLYTGAAVINGEAPLIDRIGSLCRNVGAAFHVEEIDPDVFGEELDKPDYQSVERIAALDIRITKAATPANTDSARRQD